MNEGTAIPVDYQTPPPCPVGYLATDRVRSRLLLCDEEMATCDRPKPGPRVRKKPLKQRRFFRTTPDGSKVEVTARFTGHSPVLFTRLDWRRNGVHIATTFAEGDVTSVEPDWTAVDHGETPTTPTNPARERLRHARAASRMNLRRFVEKQATKRRQPPANAD